MIHMYLPRVLRAMYDKSSFMYKGKEIINSQFVIQALVNAFALHAEWFVTTMPLYQNAELPIDIEKHSTFGGPLTALLKIASNIIEHKPRELANMMKKPLTSLPLHNRPLSSVSINSSVQITNSIKQNTSTSEELKQAIKQRHLDNINKLCNSLLSMVFVLNVEHPDFTKLLELILLIARMNITMKVQISLKLLNHWPKNEWYNYIIILVENVVYLLDFSILY